MSGTLLKRWARQAARRLGWEVQRLKNANVDYQALRNILHATGANVVLDVGANIGQYGDLLFSTGFGGKLISFEALPDVHKQLVDHVRPRRERWVVAPCAALGAERGRVEMHVSANSVSSSVLGMRELHLAAAPQSKLLRTEFVNIERLDELAPPLIPPQGLLLIKIDTQGYEMEVLKGSVGLLPQTVAIQMELSLAPLYEGAPPFMDMIAYAASIGFEPFSFVPAFVDERTGRMLQVDGFFVRLT